MKYKDSKSKRGFTLIELVAVLVVLAIITLIVTPLVMNIVKKAKDSANKRSVDAYGKALELSITTYLLDTGDYPTSLDNLTVEYTGNEVVCNIKTLNEDGSIYLSECSVKGTEAKDSSTEDGYYHYGKTIAVEYDSYVVGDKVTYNGMQFYVIENSDSKSDRVTMLKAEPLSVDEVNTYGIDENGINRVNRYENVSTGTAYDYSGYGAMVYYSSETCRPGKTDLNTGCTTEYDQSDVKYVVDAWAIDKLEAIDLIEDNLGYKIRLITIEEYLENCEITQGITPTSTYEYYAPQYDWMYNNNYHYWTMSQYEDSDSYVWDVEPDGRTSSGAINDNAPEVVRPVITLKKSAI